MSPILEVASIRKRFGGLVAVEDLSFAVTPGQILGLIGPNGAGKTTALNLITGLIRPDAGEVILDGEKVTGMRIGALARRGLVRTFQSASLYREMSVVGNVVTALQAIATVGVVGRIVRGRRLTESLLDRAWDLVGQTGLQAVGEAAASSLPYGQQRLLGLTMSLALNPKVILLDEPAAGMNENERQSLVKLLGTLKGQGMTVLLVEHDVPLVMAVCDRIAVINYGSKIADGKPNDVRSDPVVVEAYLGTETE